MMKKHAGFTLMEMLVVIIIIAALTGTVMLSVSSATDKAKASKIVTNLRNLKAACVMYYADNEQWPAENVTFDGVAATSDGTKKTLEGYLDRVPEKGYKVYAATSNSSSCAVSYSDKDVLTKGVVEKLKKMSKSAGLTSSMDSNSGVYSGGEEVFLKITNSNSGL